MKKFLCLLVACLLTFTPANAQTGLFLRNVNSPDVSPVTNQTWIFNTVTKQIFVWNGSGWTQVSVPFFNVSGTDPTVANDNSQGYQIGSIWINTFSKVAYVAMDVTTGAAVWSVLGVPAPPSDVGTPLVSDTGAPGGLAWEDLPINHISAIGSSTGDTLVVSGGAWISEHLPLTSIANGGATDGQVLSWSTSLNHWVPANGSAGSVISFSAGNLSPLFTTNVTNPTTNPALSFSLSNAAGNTVLGNFSGTSGAPSYGTLTVAMGGTGLNAIGTSDYVLAANHTGSANEYKHVIGTGGITVTGGTGTLTIDGSGAGSGGTVTNVSTGNLSPLFTATFSNPTTTPVLSFAASAVSAFKVYGNFTSGSAAPTFGGPILPAMGGTGVATVPTDGQIPIGKTSDGLYHAATLTPGTNVTITNGAGSITINAVTGSNTVTATASESIAAGALINLWNNSGTLNIRNADASSSKPAHGFAVNAISSSATGTVTVGNGADSGVSALTIGTQYFLGNSGAVTSTAPGAGNLLQPVGVASDPAVLQVLLGTPVQR